MSALERANQAWAHKVAELGGEAAAELNRARHLFGPMHGPHEAVGVIEEEFLEFRSAAFWGVDQRGRPADPRAEAIQLAAMALRFVLDVADKADKR